MSFHLDEKKLIKIKKNEWILKINQEKILLLMPRTAYEKKTGLLNHFHLPKNQGLIFKNHSLFHTFYLKFPIQVLPILNSFDISDSIITVPSNRVFFVNFKFKYVVEISSELNTLLKNKNHIYIFSEKISFFIYHFFKSIKYFLFLILVFSFGLYAFSEENNNIVDTNSMLSKLINSQNEIHLKIGKTKILSLSEAPSSIENSNPEVIDVERQFNSNKLKIIAKNTGTTSLSFLFPSKPKISYDIDVSEDKKNNYSFSKIFSQNSQKSSNSYVDEIFHNTKDIYGITPILKNEKIILHGKIDRMIEFKKLSNLVLSHPNVFYPNYEIQENIKPELLHFVNLTLKNLGEYDLNLQEFHGFYTLKGVGTTSFQKDKIWKYVSELIPNVVDGVSPLFGQTQMVQVSLRFYEVTRSQKNEEGIHNILEGGLNTNILVSNDNGMLEKPIFQLAPFSSMMRFLNSQNDIKIISKPVLMSRSGENAHFLAGGEIPILTKHENSTQSSSEVTFKPYGIIFNILPTIEDKNKIWLALNVEFSYPQNSLSIDNIPSFQSKKISTNILIENGKAVLLSGLVQNSNEIGKENVPFLSKIPILGELFKSEKFTNNDSELYILITALIDSNNHQSEEDNFNDTYHNKNNKFLKMENLLKDK